MDAALEFSREPDLSYIIRTDGQIVPAMPDDEEFSLQEIRDYVAGPPEVARETHDGYLLFHNKEGRERGFAANTVATVISRCSTRAHGILLGRAFLAHPSHVPAFWRLRSSVA